MKKPISQARRVPISRYPPFRRTIRAIDDNAWGALGVERLQINRTRDCRQSTAIDIHMRIEFVLIDGDQRGDNAPFLAQQHVEGPTGRARIHPFERHARGLGHGARGLGRRKESLPAADDQDVALLGVGQRGRQRIGRRAVVRGNPGNGFFDGDDDGTPVRNPGNAKTALPVRLDDLAPAWNRRRDVDPRNGSGPTAPRRQPPPCPSALGAEGSYRSASASRRRSTNRCRCRCPRSWQS